MKILLYTISKTKFLLKARAPSYESIINDVIKRHASSDLSLRASFIRQKSHNRPLSKKLLLSPSEATTTLRTHEETVDVESTCPIKYYDINYLGSNSPPEDRQAQAKLNLHDIYMFGVFDGYNRTFLYNVIC